MRYGDQSRNSTLVCHRRGEPGQIKHHCPERQGHVAAVSEIKDYPGGPTDFCWVLAEKMLDVQPKVVDIKTAATFRGGGSAKAVKAFAKKKKKKIMKEMAIDVSMAGLVTMALTNARVASRCLENAAFVLSLCID